MLTAFSAERFEPIDWQRDCLRVLACFKRCGLLRPMSARTRDGDNAEECVQIRMLSAVADSQCASTGSW